MRTPPAGVGCGRCRPGDPPPPGALTARVFRGDEAAGTGIERIYPAEHQQLAEEILRTGALVSQFWPEARPTKVTESSQDEEAGVKCTNSPSYRPTSAGGVAGHVASY